MIASQMTVVDEHGTFDKFRTPTFIGRTEEMERLLQAWRAAEDARPGCVMLEGEAGAGKSRLLAEFHERVVNSGGLVLSGRAIPMRGSVPLVPLATILRRLIHTLGRDEVVELAGGGGEPLGWLVPELMGDDRGRPLQVGQPSVQGRLFEHILGFLGRLADDRTVVVTVEDLHWADLTTQDLLSFLVREIRSERLLLLGSYRPEAMTARNELRHVVADLCQARLAERFELTPFSRSEVNEQVLSLTGQRPSPSAIDSIYSRSGGNPLMVEELTDTGAGDALPRTVLDSVLLRVGALSQGARDVLQLASAAGSEVPHDVLEAAVGLERPALNKIARELVERHFLTATDEGYVFRHALIQEAVYQDLLPGERISLHDALARAVQAGLDLGARPSPSTLGCLAYHWDRAGALTEAIPAYREAARASMAASAFHEAHAQLERALVLADQVPIGGLEFDKVEIMHRAASSAGMAGNHDRAVQLVTSTLELVDQGDNPHLAGSLQLDLAHYLWQVGAKEESFNAASAAAAVIPVDPPSEALARSLLSLARARMLSGAITESKEIGERALRVAQEVGASNMEAAARQVLGLDLTLLSTPRAGEEQLREAVRIARELQDVHEITAGNVTLAVVLESMGRLSDAHQTIEEARGLSQDMGFDRTYGLWLIANQAHFAFKLGEWTDARNLANEVLEERRRPTLVAAQLAHATLAELDHGQGRLTPARSHVEAASGIAARQWNDPAPYMLAEQARLEGNLARALAIVLDALDGRTPNLEARGDSASLCWLGMRIASDLHETARTLRQPTIEECKAAAETILDQIRVIRSSIGVDEVESFPEIKALLRMAEAEHGRLNAVNDAGTWQAIGQDWHLLGQPHPRSYALYREAEAAMADTVDRTWAGNALTSAFQIVLQLEANPLRQDIENLARRARIDLFPPTEVEVANGEPSAVEKVGLTPRELDVLELLVEGRSNPEIADQLYISVKTASVHVSHILMKLQVTNRVEAAGVAYRLDLV